MPGQSRVMLRDPSVRRKEEHVQESLLLRFLSRSFSFQSEPRIDLRCRDCRAPDRRRQSSKSPSQRGC
jgi:hypothetical protein